MSDETYNKWMMAQDEARKARIESSELRGILRDLLDGLDTATMIGRGLLYVGAILWAWFRLQDRALAIAIASTLTAAHLIMWFREYLHEQRRKFEKY
jgi:hypothetical protein